MWYYFLIGRRASRVIRLGLRSYPPGASRGPQLHMLCLPVFFLLLVALVGGSDCGRVPSINHKLQCWPLVWRRQCLEPTYELRDGAASKNQLIQWAIDRIKGLQAEIEDARSGTVRPRGSSVASGDRASPRILVLSRIIHFPDESTPSQVIEGASKFIGKLEKELEGLQPRLVPESNETSIQAHLESLSGSDLSNGIILLRRANSNRLGRRLLVEAARSCLPQHGQTIGETDVEQHLYKLRAQIETLHGQINDLEGWLKALRAVTGSTDRLVGILCEIQLRESPTKPASLPYTPSLDRLELEFFALRDIVGLDSKEGGLGTVLSIADVAISNLTHHRSQLLDKMYEGFLAALEDDSENLYIANALLIELREQALLAHDGLSCWPSSTFNHAANPTCLGPTTLSMGLN